MSNTPSSVEQCFITLNEASEVGLAAKPSKNAQLNVGPIDPRWMPQIQAAMPTLKRVAGNVNQFSHECRELLAGCEGF
jgi:hypothetical protein